MMTLKLEMLRTHLVFTLKANVRMSSGFGGLTFIRIDKSKHATFFIFSGGLEEGPDLFDNVSYALILWL